MWFSMLSVQGSEINVDPTYMEQFTGLNRVLEALRGRQLDQALE